MGKRLLVKYIRQVVEAHLARVPNQLVSDDKQEGSDSGDEDEGMDEFAGVGGIAGYTAPLGMDPDRLGRKKNKPRK
jgi:hypothetical protein